MKNMKKLPLFLTMCLFALAPGLAMADGLDNSADEFAQSDKVDNKELDTMRGGFIDPTGGLIESLSFLQTTRLLDGDMNVISSQMSSLTLADLQGMSGQDLESILPPTIIQNAVDGAQIINAQMLNITTQNMMPTIAQAVASTQLNTLAAQ